VIEKLRRGDTKKIGKIRDTMFEQPWRENLLSFLVNYCKMHQHQDDEMKVGGELKKKPADRACSREGERVRR
jgi:hypothetical protein